MDDERRRSLFVGNLANQQVTEAILHELFTQVGPVEKVVIPKNKQTNLPANYAFVTFKHEASVMYATNVLAGTQLYNRPLKLQLRDGGAGSTPQQSPSTPRQYHQQQEYNTPHRDYKRDHSHSSDTRVQESYPRDRYNDRSQERNRYQDRPQERYYPQERSRDSRRRHQPYPNQHQQSYQRNNRNRR